MIKGEDIRRFAEKWIAKFHDENSTDFDLADHFLADDCDTLGFKMDCGHSFAEKYGRAERCWEELTQVIDRIDDMELLGSAIYSRWRYFNHWAGVGESICDEKNRKWFIIALEKLLSLAEDSFLFRGTPQKIRIVSNNIGYGLRPDADEEVEQHITINKSGQVWYSSFCFGPPMHKLMSRRFTISQEDAEKILSAAADYFGNDYEQCFATDIGVWGMEFTNTENQKFFFDGSLCSEIMVGNVDLSDMIREILDMDNLYLFDGNNMPDKIQRISIDYHRVTKIKSEDVDADIQTEYVTWDYSEQLTIDRISETMEHIQQVGTGCRVSKKYEVQEGISNLLDSFDADTLFSTIVGNPPDVVYNELETKTYTITLDYQKAPQRVIQGDFDRDSLPDDYSEFADSIYHFIRFYGLGELFDSELYGRAKRRSSDYMYCGVSFSDGYKKYHYISDDDSIAEGDYVVVPAGKDNHEAIVKVESVEYFSEDEVPFPIEKTKHILRKATDEDIAPLENDDLPFRCPVAEREIYEADCLEISDVANGLLSPSILNDYNPPILWNDEKATICRMCKYHFE